MFWDISSPAPVILDAFPFVKDTLVPINSVLVKFAVSLVDKESQRHPEALKFEQVLTANLLRSKNAK